MSAPMPRCQYCGVSPYETYCKSFYYHVEGCRVLYDRMKEKETLREMERLREAKALRKLDKSKKGHPQKIVVNNYIQTLVMGNQNVYLDYPKNETTQRVIHDATTFDIKTIKSIEDLNQIVGQIQDMNDKEIEKCLCGQDQAAQFNALSFLADLVRVIRTRLQKEAPFQILLIEAAEEFEKECLDDKKKLVPTVEDI